MIRGQIMSVQKKCSFCGKDFPSYQGVTLIRTDASILNFCSSKCRINSQKLKRDPRKLKWTSRRKEDN
ncbi:MAG: 50S ribosomal protein L24e [Nitrososphaerales archaeon]